VEKWNNPFIDKLIGLPTEKEHLTPAWDEHILETIYQEGGRKITEFEIEKSERDREIIDFAQSAADRMLAAYGRQKTAPVPLENIHLLRDGGTRAYLSKIKAVSGAAAPIQQSLMVDRVESDMQLSLITFHELLHLKSYIALQVMPANESNQAAVRPYRYGLTVYARDGKTRCLNSLEEAVIGYLTQEFYTNIQKEPRFENEIKRIAEGNLHIEISRNEEYENLSRMIETIVKTHPELTSKELLEMFIKAQVTGNIMAVTRLIEETFGKGSTRGY